MCVPIPAECASVARAARSASVPGPPVNAPVACFVIASPLCQLADHAKQGVYQNGGWERQWVVQAFGDGWLERTEPGDPYDRTNDQLDVELSQRMYRRPKRV